MVTIGEGVFTNRLCLCILDMCVLLRHRELNSHKAESPQLTLKDGIIFVMTSHDVM